jgi:hypothetical protein
MGCNAHAALAEVRPPVCRYLERCNSVRRSQVSPSTLPSKAAGGVVRKINQSIYEHHVERSQLNDRLPRKEDEWDVGVPFWNVCSNYSTVSMIQQT